MKFLVVDDDPAILKITRKFLELEGHEVVCCELALDALQKLSDRSFDILITDATMPAYSGFDLIRSIRKKKSLSGLTIAMLTGRSEKSDIEQALELGVQDYIVKPIQPDVFMAKVANLVSRHRSHSQKNTKDLTENSLHTFMKIPVSINRITDIGISIETPFPLEKGMEIQMDIKQFAEMGITSNRFKTLFCKPNRAKYFLSDLLLLDLDARQKKQLETLAHRWVLKKVS